MTDATCGQGCIPEDALSEHAVQLLAGQPLLPAVESHLAACAECRRRWNQLCEEAAKIRALLSPQTQEASKQCLDDETLAGYLDKSLAMGKSRSVQAHLARCAGCRKRIVAMYKCLQSLNFDISPSTPEEVHITATTTAGETVQATPKPVTKPRNASKAPESRKRRYSSGSS